MSIQIWLAVNNSSFNSVNKTITYPDGAMNGTLRNESNMVNPTILLEADISTVSKYNYLYISAFSRFYFITEIKSVRTGIVEIHAHCDVLYSFRNQIKRNTAIVARQQLKYNLYLDDGVFRTYQNPDVITKEFPSGFNTQEFVLAVAGS